MYIFIFCFSINILSLCKLIHHKIRTYLKIGNCMKKLKLIVLVLIISTISHASGGFTILYKIEKGSKKLGYYDTTFTEDSIVANSYGASDRLEMFSSKKITFVKDGLKNVEFFKNKKSQKFIVATKVSSLDKALRKKYDRKFKKVKDDAMLFITRDSKKRIELFNKRKTVVKTLDEFLADIYNGRVSYDKFILFDKLGVMKMVAGVSKSADTVTITNASKKKPYMKITLDKNIPLKIESLLSTWVATMEKSGVAQMHTLDLNTLVSKSYKSGLKKDLQNAEVTITKAKKTKNSYNFSGEISFALASDMTSKKSYKQKEYCKKLLKKSKVKFKKLSLHDGICTAEIKINMKIKKLKKDVLKLLIQDYPQLKMTKKIQFNKNSITYEVL